MSMMQTRLLKRLQEKERMRYIICMNNTGKFMSILMIGL